MESATPHHLTKPIYLLPRDGDKLPRGRMHRHIMVVAGQRIDEPPKLVEVVV